MKHIDKHLAAIMSMVIVATLCTTLCALGIDVTIIDKTGLPINVSHLTPTAVSNRLVLDGSAVNTVEMHPNDILSVYYMYPSMNTVLGSITLILSDEMELTLQGNPYFYVITHVDHERGVQQHAFTINAELNPDRLEVVLTTHPASIDDVQRHFAYHTDLFTIPEEDGVVL